MKNEFLERIYELSVDSFNADEIPVGAIVVKNGEIIGYGINSREKNNSIIGHAEINAIEMACNNVGDWRLDDCELYVTLKPCMMCTGAIIESRINSVYYLCDRTNVRFEPSGYVNTIKIQNEIYEEKYLNLLRLFFENKRN